MQLCCCRSRSRCCLSCPGFRLLPLGNILSNEGAVFAELGAVVVAVVRQNVIVIRSTQTVREGHSAAARMVTGVIQSMRGPESPAERQVKADQRRERNTSESCKGREKKRRKGSWGVKE